MMRPWRIQRGIAWQFTSRDARRKLERLYPVKAPSSDDPCLSDQSACEQDSSSDQETVRSG